MQNKIKTTTQKNVPYGHIRQGLGNGNQEIPMGKQPEGDGSSVTDKEYKNRPRLTFSKGELTYFESPYDFGTEATEALRGHFNRLLAQGNGTRPKFNLRRYAYHPHCCGATMRALFGDYIYYNYEKTANILDIGASLSRTAKRFDFDGQPLNQRVLSTAPILSSRDLIRQREHQDDEEMSLMVEGVNYCRCEGGLRNNRFCGDFKTVDDKGEEIGVIEVRKPCPVCAEPFKVTMSVDSAYYPGVIEEQAWHSYKTQGRGYLVFNDYDGARIKHGLCGSACDGESEYKIEGEYVTSKVRGNFAPYRHQILSTRGMDSWQYHLYIGGRDLICLFQVLQRFWNKDVPYVIVKMFAVDVEELSKFGEEMFTGVPMLSKYYREERKIIPKKIEQVEKDLNVRKLFDKQVDEFIDFTDGGLHFKEAFEDCKLKIGAYTLDFNKREEDIYSRTDELINLFRKTPMNLYVTKTKDKDMYINLELRYSAWYTFGLNLYTDVYTAPLALMVEAYDVLGQKGENKSIAHAISQLQRKILEQTGVMNFDVYEAMNLARVIRDQQLTRMENLANKCPAIRK
jgi:hypothetical protein